MKEADTSVKVGFVSRIDFGSPGFRLGMLRLAAPIFERERVHFAVIAGGLVSSRALKERFREIVRKSGFTKAEREDYFEKFKKKIVDYFYRHFPKIKSAEPDSEWAKMFVVTSPAYDGDWGKEIASQLALRRSDIVHSAHGYDIRPTRQKGRDIAVLTPTKAAWLRGKYYSTPAERVILDWRNQHYGEEPHDLVVGCFGSHFQKPGKGEFRLPIVTVPALCRLWDSRTGSENQVGLVVIEYQADGVTVVRNYNFSDLLMNETKAIVAPRNASDQQKKIVEIMKREVVPQTIGLFAHHLNLGRNRRELHDSLEALRIDKTEAKDGDKFAVGNRWPGLVKGGGKFAVGNRWPGLVYDDASKLYSFDSDWFQTRLRFKLPDCKKKKTDSLAAFGCLHAGCVHTNYGYFVNQLPDLIVERKATVLVGAGDFIEGIKHDLILRKEVFGGMNNSEQEILAGQYVGDVMLRVFQKRMTATFGERLNRNRINQPVLKKALDEALITFVYIYGNHCAWSLDSGYNPLGVFRSTLVEHVTKGIERFLDVNKLVYHNCLREWVTRRIIELDERDSYKLPSGLKMMLRHPRMSRTLTTSIRLQQVLEASDAPVVVSANFHVAAGLAHWEYKTGERYCLQVGTIKNYSDFEGGKLKRLDTGVGCLKVVSFNGRIWMTETVFDRAAPCLPLDNSQIRQLICRLNNVPTYS